MVAFTVIHCIRIPLTLVMLTLSVCCMFALVILALTLITRV
jgi:hypothetical protein